MTRPTDEDVDPDGEIDVARLPRWARVAFAARCGRRISPLFTRFWPDAIPRRSQSIANALQLAEQSSTMGLACDGLKAAALEACMTAGAALSFTTVFPCKEPGPVDKNSALLASLSAKAAEKAAEAARTESADGTFAATEAHSYVEQVARAISDIDILMGVEQDFGIVLRLTIDEGWHDATPVPPAIWPPLE